MSTSPTSSSSGFTSTSLTQPLINIGGLATGLDTNSIIAQMMQAESIPLTQLQNQQTIEQFKQTLLEGFQTQLQTVSSDIQELHSETLWAPTQTITSSEPNTVSASTTTGAGIGNYQVTVSQLASSAQRTFTYTPPTADTTVTVDGQTVAVRAGESAQDFASSLNNTGSSVYAASTDDRGTIVISSRDTGDAAGAAFLPYSASGVLSEQTSKAREGRDAMYTIDGVAGTSHSNTVNAASRDPNDTTSPVIDGVDITLTGITAANDAVSLSVGTPAPDPRAVTAALQRFVTDYNTAVDAITARLNERSVPNASTITDQEQGVLFGDGDLTNMLNSLRQAVYDPVAGLPSGMNSLASLGISTGGASSTTSQSTLNGDLTLDTDALNAALTSNPDGVRNLLLGSPSQPGWAQGFQSVVDGASAPGGLLDASINSAGDEITDLQTQITNMNTRLTTYQQTLQTEFTNMEVSVQQSQSTGQWLTSQLAGIAANSAAS